MLLLVFLLKYTVYVVNVLWTVLVTSYHGYMRSCFTMVLHVSFSTVSTVVLHVSFSPTTVLVPSGNHVSSGRYWS